MDEKAKVKGSEQPSEREGNWTAARRSNEAQRRFVRSGQVEKAREAKKALLVKSVRWGGLRPSATYDGRRPAVTQKH
jgi:hypothetical protein